MHTREFSATLVLAGHREKERRKKQHRSHIVLSVSSLHKVSDPFKKTFYYVFILSVSTCSTVYSTLNLFFLLF